MVLKPGTRLRSSVDSTEVVIVRAPAEPVELRCGGLPMVPIGTETAAADGPDADHRDGTLLGKRYTDPNVGLEVLCTKAGEGSLAIGDQALSLKDAKPLPSSD